MSLIRAMVQCSQTLIFPMVSWTNGAIAWKVFHESKKIESWKGAARERASEPLRCVLLLKNIFTTSDLLRRRRTTTPLIFGWLTFNKTDGPREGLSSWSQFWRALRDESTWTLSVQYARRYFPFNRNDVRTRKSFFFFWLGNNPMLFMIPQ